MARRRRPFGLFAYSAYFAVEDQTGSVGQAPPTICLLLAKSPPFECAQEIMTLLDEPRRGEIRLIQCLAISFADPVEMALDSPSR